MSDEKTSTTRLEESREVMKDLALPPGYHLGVDPDDRYMVIKDSSEEIFAVDGSEEDLPHVVIDLWREYVQNAEPAVVCRMAHAMIAVDALIEWDGELSGGPRDRMTSDDLEEVNYECTLWGKGGVASEGALGHADDPVEAILAARRAMLDSLVALDVPHDPEDEDDFDEDDEA